MPLTLLNNETVLYYIMYKRELNVRNSLVMTTYNIPQ